jgi:hypothetical protein
MYTDLKILFLSEFFRLHFYFPHIPDCIVEYLLTESLHSSTLGFMATLDLATEHQSLLSGEHFRQS